jgi:hypothetical protein
MEYPYNDLINTNRSRNRNQFEYELLDTGIFNDDRYFDVYVEYAKVSPEDILVEVTAFNRGKDTATLHLLPTLWFRNIWHSYKDVPKPELKEKKMQPDISVVEANDHMLGKYYLFCEGDVPLLFTENETNNQRLFNSLNTSKYVKDGINNYIVNNDKEAVNPEKNGTKAAVHYHIVIGAGEAKTIRLRLSNISPKNMGKETSIFNNFDDVMETRRKEADQFYESISPASLNEDERHVLRQALSGMLWTKQFYDYDVAKWLNEHGIDFYNKTARGINIRNFDWFHMANTDIISMPDKWEYPWYAAWDLAFHTVALSLVDGDFAREQLNLMLTERYLHPNGQTPAYEWNFNDVNPPVHAWAVLFNHRMQQQL